MWAVHQPQGKEGHSQGGSEKYIEFVSNIPLKDSMQESDMVWQHCREQLREGGEWVHRDRLGSYCNDLEDGRWRLKLGW